MPFRTRSIALACLLGVALGLAAWKITGKIAAAPGENARLMAAYTPAAGGDGFDPANIGDMKVGGPFTLTDQDGRTVTDKTYADRYKLVYFGFASCPDICPTELKKFDTVLKTLGAEAQKIAPIFVTTDPERDTPEVMKDYVALFNPAIIGLTGSPEQLKQIEDEYKVYAVREDNPEMKTYVMNHSSFTYFLAPDGKLLLLFRSEDPADFMAAHIRAAMQKR
jgi:protein SCO1/2